jgi:hypothetical protein
MLEFLEAHGAATCRQLAAQTSSHSASAYIPIGQAQRERLIRLSPLNPALGAVSQMVAQLATNRSAWTLEQLQLADLAITTAQGPMPWEWIPGDPPSIQQGAIVLPVLAARETDAADGTDAIQRIRAHIEATGARELCYADWDTERARRVFQAFKDTPITLHAGWRSFRDRADRRLVQTHAEQIREAYRRLDALRAGEPVLTPAL